jgi:hypothetical protein
VVFVVDITISTFENETHIDQQSEARNRLDAFARLRVKLNVPHYRIQIVEWEPEIQFYIVPIHAESLKESQPYPEYIADRQDLGIEYEQFEQDLISTQESSASQRRLGQGTDLGEKGREAMKQRNSEKHGRQRMGLHRRLIKAEAVSGEELERALLRLRLRIARALSQSSGRDIEADTAVITLAEDMADMTNMAQDYSGVVLRCFGVMILAARKCVALAKLLLLLKNDGCLQERREELLEAFCHAGDSLRGTNKLVELHLRRTVSIPSVSIDEDDDEDDNEDMVD